MKKRKRILFIAVLVLILCAFGLVLFSSHEPSEPAHQGKPLSYWLAGYSPGQYQADHPKGPPPPTWQEADEAIRRMGTNALPALLRKLQQHDSKFKTTVWSLIHRQHFFEIPYLRLGQDFAAYQAIQKLGPTAGMAVPELIHIYERDNSAFAQQGIPAIMSFIGPAARPAIPMLLRAATHTNEVVRNNALHALGQIRAEPERVIPAMLKCLNDPDAHVQAQAIESIGRFGTNAQSAVPVLVEMLRQETANPSGKTWPNFSTSVGSLWQNGSTMWGGPSSPPFSTVLRDALKAINAETAANAGIK